MKKKPKYPDLVVTFRGFFSSRMIPEAVGYVGSEMKKSGVTQDEVNEYYTEARKGDVRKFLETTAKWVTVKRDNISFKGVERSANTE